MSQKLEEGCREGIRCSMLTLLYRVSIILMYKIDLFDKIGDDDSLVSY